MINFNILSLKKLLSWEVLKKDVTNKSLNTLIYTSKAIWYPINAHVYATTVVNTNR